MRILFMGTPEIAAACLKAILDEGKHTVCGAYTREDKPVGRKQVLTAPPVKQLALERGIPVFQPKTLRDGEAARTIRRLAPDIIVVVAYGRILPQEVLDIPPHGAVNLHVSLLPAYRGAAPVQWSVINGDKKTGVTIMQLDAGLDTGDILAVAPVDIGENETSGELFSRVTAVGAKALCAALEEIEAGRAHPAPQDHARATPVSYTHLGGGRQVCAAGRGRADVRHVPAGGAQVLRKAQFEKRGRRRRPRGFCRQIPSGVIV